jgi:hypothetical protein
MTFLPSSCGQTLPRLACLFTPSSLFVPGMFASQTESIRMPLSFEYNKGQTEQQVQYLSRNHGGRLLFEKDAVVFEKPGSDKGRLRMELAGSDPGVAIDGEDGTLGRVNYLIGNKPEQWRRNIPVYSKIRYHRVYKSTDLVFLRQ